MSIYPRTLSIRGLVLILCALTLMLSGCNPTLPDLGPTGAEVEPLEDDGIAAVPPEPPLVEGAPDPNPEVVLTAEAGGDLAATVGIGLEFTVAADETIYDDALVSGVQLAIQQINESDYLGEGQQMALVVNGAVLPVDATTLDGQQQAALDTIVASLGPVLPYANSQEMALPLKLRPDTGTDVFGTSQYVDNWIYHPGVINEDLTLQTVLKARDYLNVNTVALISVDATEAALDLLTSTLEEQGIDVVTAVSLNEGYNATQLLLEVGELNPNVILLNTPVTVAADLLLAAQGMTFPTRTYFIAGAGIIGPPLVDLAGGASHGLLGGIDWMIVPPFTPDEGFAEAFQTVYGAEPHAIGAQAYAATWLLAEAIRVAGAADAGAIGVALADLSEVETPFGVITVDTEAPLGLATLLLVNEDGEIVVVGE